VVERSCDDGVAPLNRLYVDIVAGVSELRDQLPQQRALRNVRLSDVPNAAVLPADLVDPEERRSGSGRGTSDASDGSTSSCSGIVGGSWSASINPASGEASGSIESGEKGCGTTAGREAVRVSVRVTVCDCQRGCGDA